MRLLVTVFLIVFLLTACADYRVKNLVKTDIDLVADEFIAESRTLVLELMVKLYKRNPDQLAKGPGLSLEQRLAQLRDNPGALEFDELGGVQGIDAMNLAFEPEFSGDRVFALVVGLGGMLRQAYGYREEMFVLDSLDSETLHTSARNVEVLAWKLKNNRREDGSFYLISHQYRGKVDNLSFERLFGKLIALQDMMARIAGGAGERAVNTAVHTVSRVFIPLPL